MGLGQVPAEVERTDGLQEHECKDYTGLLVQFGETSLFHCATNDDKLAPRWVKGVFVGKIVETDEFLYLTPAGAKRWRSVKRLTDVDAWDPSFLATAKGTPWNTSGAQQGEDKVVKGTALLPGNRQRRMYITHSMVVRFPQDA